MKYVLNYIDLKRVDKIHQLRIRHDCYLLYAVYLFYHLHRLVKFRLYFYLFYFFH